MTFGFSTRDVFPHVLLPSTPPFSTGVSIVVTNAVLNPNYANSIAINTTLTVSDVSMLNGSTLSCEDATNFGSGVNITVLSGELRRLAGSRAAIIITRCAHAPYAKRLVLSPPPRNLTGVFYMVYTTHALT